MKLRVLPLVGLLLLALLPAAQAQQPAPSPLNPAAYQLTNVVPHLDWVLEGVDAYDGSGRLFLVTRIGKIWILKDGELLDQPFLDISSLLDDLVNSTSDMGMHGLVFDPDYENNGLFYITYEGHGPTAVLARYNVSPDDPNQADPDSAQILITTNKQFISHTIAQLAFGPDGYLYVGSGDGGPDQWGFPDPFGAGQRTDEIFGSILRIDVHSDAHPYGIPPDNPFAGMQGHAQEIWVYGLRNPSRFSFDRLTGDVYIGDVGVDTWEEIDVVPAGSGGGQNFGWSYYEGPVVLPSSGRNRYSVTVPLTMPDTEVVWPALAYPHEDSNCAVIGGYVYRGAALPDLQGVYLYGDVCTGRIWGARLNEQGGLMPLGLLFDTDFTIVAFGEDEQGELYVINYNGTVEKITPATAD
jgi:glucose/arabinose dehydrogenase